MERILLISTSQLKEFTDITQNVDDSILECNIYDAQKMKLESTLGTKLYNYFITNYNNVQEPFLSLYKDYMFDCLINWSKYYSLHSMYLKLVNVGVVNKSGEFSTSTDINGFKMLMKEQESRGEYYSKRLEDYLCANMNVFGDYINNDSWDKKIIDNKSMTKSCTVFDDYSKNYNKKDERYY
jgi:hypothetical protein